MMLYNVWYYVVYDVMEESYFLVCCCLIFMFRKCVGIGNEVLGDNNSNVVDLLLKM